MNDKAKEPSATLVALFVKENILLYYAGILTVLRKRIAAITFFIDSFFDPYVNWNHTQSTIGKKPNAISNLYANALYSEKSIYQLGIIQIT